MDSPQTIILKPLIIIVIAFMLWGTSCNDKEDLNPIVEVPENTNFLDYGFIPASLTAGVDVAEFQSLVYYNNSVFVATSDGVWMVDLKKGNWSRSGLKGKLITALYQHPEVEGLFYAGVQSNYNSTFKTLYISKDGGRNWKAAAQPIFDAHSNKYEDYACFAARPGYPNHIYANLEGGTTIAVSTDQGNTWQRMNNKEYSYFGYRSIVAFLHNDAHTLFQGSETPLDYAWLGSYDIDGSNPVLLGNFTYIVDIEQWSNRRPTQLKTFSFAPGNIYIGQEGALSLVHGTESKFIFKKSDNEFMYPYIYAIWVNPYNPQHLLFGGGLHNEEQPMQLYETVDEGKTIYRFELKFGLENPIVADIIQAGDYPAILLFDKGAEKVKLLTYKQTITAFKDYTY